MIYSSCGYLVKEGKVLMLYRNKKKNDVNAGKWIGVGGKKEQGEDMETCMRREIREETGLVVGKLKEEGIIDFIYPHKEAEKITIYTSSDFHGDITECNEGTLAWIDKNKIPDLSLWEGDRIFLKLLEDGEDFFSLKLVYNTDDGLEQAVLNGRALKLQH